MYLLLSISYTTTTDKTGKLYQPSAQCQRRSIFSN